MKSKQAYQEVSFPFPLNISRASEKKCHELFFCRQNNFPSVFSKQTSESHTMNKVFVFALCLSSRSFSKVFFLSQQPIFLFFFVICLTMKQYYFSKLSALKKAERKIFCFEFKSLSCRLGNVSFERMFLMCWTALKTLELRCSSGEVISTLSGRGWKPKRDDPWRRSRIWYFSDGNNDLVKWKTWITRPISWLCGSFLFTFRSLYCNIIIEFTLGKFIYETTLHTLGKSATTKVWFFDKKGKIKFIKSNLIMAKTVSSNLNHT